MVKKILLSILLLTLTTNICSCKKNTPTPTTAPIIKESESSKDLYELTISKTEQKEAEDDCKNKLLLLLDIYKKASKGNASNVILTDKTLFKMQNKLKKEGYPVTISISYSNMENYKSIEKFLQSCQNKISSSTVFYQIHSDGNLERSKLIFDGLDMYLLTACATWNNENTPFISYLSYNKIENWSYTDKGWFGYELAVAQPPETSSTTDACCLIRIKPLPNKQRKLSKKYVQPIGYQGNNLLSSNWDINHLEKLDYNGIFEFFYEIKYKKHLTSKDYSNGIPKDEFENLIMEYLPITKKQLQKYAVFDKEKQTYAWIPMNCLDYTPTFFGTSLPEVTKVTKNKNGTTTLTVDAVYDMTFYDDALVTSKLTVRFKKDGSFQYLGNKIVKDELDNTSNYEYRINVLSESS